MFRHEAEKCCLTKPTHISARAAFLNQHHGKNERSVESCSEEEQLPLNRTKRQELEELWSRKGRKVVGRFEFVSNGSITRVPGDDSAPLRCISDSLTYDWLEVRYGTDHNIMQWKLSHCNGASL